ncbi:MAG: inosine/xanthosine triphosphatase [Acidobacteriota bacterium]
MVSPSSPQATEQAQSPETAQSTEETKATETVVAVASENPVKIEATRLAFEALFPHLELTLRSMAVPSGVSDQPMGDAETRRGAENRARSLARAIPGASYWVGLEGGIDDDPDSEVMRAFAWAVVLAPSPVEGAPHTTGSARSATFPLPPPVARLVRDGLELGAADDQVFATEASKRQGGAVGLLTGGVITRTDLYQPAVVLALLPFLRPDLYWPGSA